MSNFRSYIILLLMLVLATQVLHKAAFIAYFKINRAYIIQQHCVNKSKPELKCDGKCHLKKYLAQSSLEEDVPEENEPVPSFPGLEFLKNVNLYFIHTAIGHTTDTYFHLLAITTHRYINQPIDKMGRTHTTAVFHPPTLG